MEHIYTFLNNVWLDLKTENSIHFSFIPFVLLCCSIPLPLGISNIFLGLFVASVLLKPKQFTFQVALVLPVLFFSLYAASILWSIDVSKSIKSLPKEIGLLLIPLLFMIMKPFSKEQVNKIMKYYSYMMVLYVIFYIIKAIIRYFISGNPEVFFYHELVTLPVNAIHVSVYVALAFFYFFNRLSKTITEIFICFLLFAFLLLLSSKNILLVSLGILIVNYFFVFRKTINLKTSIFLVVAVFFVIFLFFGKIKERFNEEFQSNLIENIDARKFNNNMQGVNVISAKEAWENKKFTPNDYFPGIAFRVLQIRIFCELLVEEPIKWKGFGLNAAQKKIDEKVETYNLFEGNEELDGYLNKNFHNQYIQIFAEIGFFGLLIILTMLFFNSIKTIQTKDFMQITFAILMISLFLTESFLSRQRGIMFFILLYCLFNAKNTNAPEIK
ncbi:O-antigen ligase family protein [Flavobacterium orientale]|uniref:O-antigen ligase family protein n=1 Tax=Flavobacterium orientale TaxID=1756020 RepID=UPI001667AA96|nr:O-antigen ligase family protein [Flavobacterium orientale]